MAKRQAESGDPFGAYIKSIGSSFQKEKTEHTDRGAIKALLQSFAPSGITIIPEPRQVAGSAPDFKVRQNGQIVGYLEAKPLGTGIEELRRIIKTEQITRYRSLSPNLIVTDYLNWIWLKNGREHFHTLCSVDDVYKHNGRILQAKQDEVGGLLKSFLSTPPQRIGRASDLADQLAVRTRVLRDFLREELLRQEDESQGERLYGLYLAFKNQVSESISLDDFSDAFAQTLSYGLFLSKLNANGYSLKLNNAKQYVPKSFKLIQELVGFLDVLHIDYYKDIEWVVDEVLSIINGLDVLSVKEDLSFRNRKGTKNLRARDEEEWRLFSRDPFIYFYEDFLAEYDTKLRKSRGVYYTPPPVVNFIVRSVDDVLKQEMQIKSGVADAKQVTILEFACGTGTFIVEMIEKIIENTGSSPGKIELAIKEHALKNIFAFEYMIAPYTIAHLKLSQYLEDRQIRIGPDQPFNILLTNTLEPIDPQRNFLVPALSEESRRAQNVKKEPILVITGNPPYSRFSKNKGEWITKLIETYKYVDGVHFGERKHWLDDDYVKFFRFAEDKMSRVERGVIAIITNHSWIDNPTFRGMRQSLRSSFDTIYVLNLRGNSKRKEAVPQGVRDENVFDIQQGVAITILAKTGSRKADVKYADLWGSRLQKYRFLSEQSLDSIEWESCVPVSPFYFFTPNAPKEFDKWFELKGLEDIFEDHATGAVSGRDPLVISFDEVELGQKKRVLLKGDENDARLAFGSSSSSVHKIAYRPFDNRVTYFTGKARGFWSQPSQPTAKHVLGKENIILAVTRRVEEGEFKHAFVFENVVDCHAVSSKETTHTFLFWKYDDFGVDEIKRPNVRPQLIKFLQAKWKKADVKTDEVLGYLYGVLYSETYRQKFEEFLRIDFPRIPFPDSFEAFRKISELGWKIADAHLMRNLKTSEMASYQGAGNHQVEKLRYVESEQALYINSTQYFGQLPPDVWTSTIGGYRPIEKYLNARKGRALSLSDVEHIPLIAESLSATISLMEEVDIAYKTAFS
jgi:Type ISP C-terminal specificity domain/N-6 DNA Methylase